MDGLVHFRRPPCGAFCSLGSGRNGSAILSASTEGVRHARRSQLLRASPMVAFVSDPASASGSASARLTDAASDGADPILSVIMPVHEGAEWIAATLDSLAAEPTDGLEIIVIDSSPTAQTSEIVSGFADCVPLKLLHRPDLTPWQTKTNVGID